jgi:hypothetical protein
MTRGAGTAKCGRLKLRPKVSMPNCARRDAVPRKFAIRAGGGAPRTWRGTRTPVDRAWRPDRLDQTPARHPRSAAGKDTRYPRRYSPESFLQRKAYAGNADHGMPCMEGISKARIEFGPEANQTGCIGCNQLENTLKPGASSSRGLCCPKGTPYSLPNEPHRGNIDARLPGGTSKLRCRLV